ncbi:MAG: Fe-S cluster assembly protein HesB [Actinobacteria bacterium]|nr:Fe-S cluster assembly protein HesB [Actinomycetota bacterium]
MVKILIPITGDDASDRLLQDEPLALVIGMLLDQQVPMEWAFKGPATLRERLGGQLDAASIAAMDVEEFVAICSEKPAVHRFPSSMGSRVHDLCAFILDRYDGDAGRIWKGVRSAPVLLERIRELPGYGEEKSKILLAILAKRLGKRPNGWEEAAAPFSDDEPRSVADVGSREQLLEVREWKQMMKSARKSKADQAPGSSSNDPTRR